MSLLLEQALKKSGWRGPRDTERNASSTLLIVDTQSEERTHSRPGRAATPARRSRASSATSRGMDAGLPHAVAVTTAEGH